MEKILLGYVNPRYLNYDWNRMFSVTAQPTKSADIPVKVVFEALSYEAAKFTNEQMSYQEMKDEFSRMKAFLCVNELLDNYSNWITR